MSLYIIIRKNYRHVIILLLLTHNSVSLSKTTSICVRVENRFYSIFYCIMLVAGPEIAMSHEHTRHVTRVVLFACQMSFA